MNVYQYNCNCRCTRCRARGIMGPAILITLGILFLLDNLDIYGTDFHRTWPVILLVIGVVKILQSGAPDAGHIFDVPSPSASPESLQGEVQPPSSEVHHG